MKKKVCILNCELNFIFLKFTRPSLMLFFFFLGSKSYVINVLMKFHSFSL